MSNVAILLATYNSALYLKDLLDSIINQTYHLWNLYVIDDGSNDDTLFILNSYAKKYDNIILIDNAVSHNGAKNNFMNLLLQIDAEYYMFCDHDDIWLPNKIEISLERMMQLESSYPSIPIVIHSDLSVVDSKLHMINASFFNYSGILPKILLSSIKYLAVSNCVTGCTMLLNKAVKTCVFPMSKYALMHDSWVALRVMASNGIISCIYQPLILYRQHGHNTLGAIEKNKKKSLLCRCSDSWKQFLMAKSACKIDLPTFLLYKIKYLYKRHENCSNNCNL